MGLEVNEQVETKIFINASGSTVSYYIYDEGDVLFDSGTMSEMGSTGIYTKAWTPDAAGEWTVKITCASPNVNTAFIYMVGMGQEQVVSESQIRDVDVAFYIAAADEGTTEGSDDGGNPALLSEVSKTAATEGAGEADPAWSETWTLEPIGTVTILSIFYNLEWQMKRTGGTTAYAKWQITGDGGSSWVDVTTNLTETGTSYADHQIQHVGQHIASVDAGTTKLGMRLVSWTDGTSVQTKVRISSYIRLGYRKSVA